MAKKVSMQGEISCDEQVVKNFDFQQRQKYLESIIGVMRKNNIKVYTHLSTNYYGGKKEMEMRIKSVMNGSKKKTGIVITTLLTCVICLVIAFSVLLERYLDLKMPAGQGTKLEISSSGNQKKGFQDDASIYTDKGITNVSLSGKISVDGTAELKVVSDEDGSIVYTKTFTSKDKVVSINLKDLKPNSCYTLLFNSDNANYGKLNLKSDQSLVKSPDKPHEKPENPDE